MGRAAALLVEQLSDKGDAAVDDLVALLQFGQRGAQLHRIGIAQPDRDQRRDRLAAFLGQQTAQAAERRRVSEAIGARGVEPPAVCFVQRKALAGGGVIFEVEHLGMLHIMAFGMCATSCVSPR